MTTVHVRREDSEVKLVGVFFLLLIIEIVVFIFIKKRHRKAETKKRYRLLTLALFLFIWGITIRYMLFPPMKEIETTGSYQIASTDYWIKEDKEDPYLENGEMRELQVRKWYPVDSNEKLPVIIASHGSCGTIDNNVSLYKEMASHGYTVLAVCHPGQAATIQYSNGKGAGPSSQFISEMSSMQPQKDPEQTYEVFSKWMDIRMTDLSAVMNDYTEKEGATEFIMLGHSLGGSAAYAMSRVRTDIVGCIALESPFMYDIKGVENGEFVFDESDYNVPLLNIYSDSSYPYLHEWGQYKNNAKFLDEGNPNYTNIYYKGIGHMGLCDLSLASPLLADAFSGSFQTVDPHAQLKQLNSDCTSWLNTIRH